MTITTLILRSLRFHARTHLGAGLGAAVGSSVLIGALVVGDSVRGSLRDMALARLGPIQLALSSNDRFFRSELAAALAQKGVIDGMVVPAIAIPASASTPDDSARANRVQVLGVDERFWLLAPGQPSVKMPSTDEVVLNSPLATQLQVASGDSIILRVAKPGRLSRETPISPQEDSSVSLRLKVRAIASEAEFGRFSLRAGQAAPFNAFVSLTALQQQLNLPGRANLLLASANDHALAAVKSNVALRQTWNLADAELELRELPEVHNLELRTARVFLDPPISAVALKAATNATGILTYFVNELRSGDRATPYSMVTAGGAPLVPADMRDDQIIINQWLADDLGAGPGDKLAVRYYVVGLARRLEERTNDFTVRAVVPITGSAADHNLMPDFPGLDKAESTRDWDSSLPIELKRIRPKDEDYWKKYRGTPKAFVTLDAGQKMWSNRFGNLTAVRYPIPVAAGAAGTSNPPRPRPEEGSKPRRTTTEPPSLEGPRVGLPFKSAIEEAIKCALDPASLGLSFEPVRAQALAAAEQSQDFGGLFLGFSFFLIVAALLLMALLFQFGIEQRATEVGTLLALGFTPGQARRLFLLEGGALAVVGGLIGVGGGVGYARAMLLGLSSLWREAVQTSALRYHAQPRTFAVGALAAVLIAWLTIWLALRKQAQQPARELLEEGAMEKLQAPGSRLQSKSRAWWLAAATGLAAMLAVGWAFWQRDAANAELFFSAGALLLIAGLALAAGLLSSLAGGPGGVSAKFSLSEIGVRNCARRRKRSVATLGLLACGSFLIASIGVFRLDAVKDSDRRQSGTGGFALIGESTLPIVQDLNSKPGRDFFGLDDQVLTGVTFVPFRVREGDDASCLNLNRAQRPRLFGVKPDLLADRRAFTFKTVAKGLSAENPWLLLKTSPGRASVPAGQDSGADGTTPRQEPRAPVQNFIPAIGDEASIVWAMGKKVGDTLEYTDERGRIFDVRIVAALANSILQGNLLIAEDEFVARFPSEAGYRFFLIDAPTQDAVALSKVISRALRDSGLELTPATRRLAAFNAVQNTYLSTFQALGGLGLLLGSVGLGVVVMRNVFERRGELALLSAVGFHPRALKWLVMSEHGALLLLGLGVGLVAALAAVLPALLSPGAAVPYRSLALTLATVLISGAAWTWIATALALRGRVVDALRNE